MIPSAELIRASTANPPTINSSNIPVASIMALFFLSDIRQESIKSV